jgi:CO/xanthine dehydrogenase FAD-binding subunit
VLTQVHVPSSAAEAAGLLRDGGWLVGGGTVVMPKVNAGAVPVDSLVSLRRAGLAGITVADGAAEIGAATTLTALGAHDVHDGLAFLRPVVRSIASPPVRNLATVGGNLFAAQPHGDLAVALLALDARLDVVSADGARGVAVGEPVEPTEVVTAVHFALPAAGSWRYTKAMRRKHNSASICTVAAVVTVADGVVTAARIALGGVAPRPVLATAAAEALVGRPLDVAAATEAGEAARADAEPFDDAYASAWYRDRVLPVHVRRALAGE